jgi:tetratricopeptide (TPR) repeat protein
LFLYIQPLEIDTPPELLQKILRSVPALADKHWLEPARKRTCGQLERRPSITIHCDVSSAHYDVYLTILSPPDTRRRYLYSLGEFGEAARAFAEVHGSTEQEAWAAFHMGKALRADALLEEAVAVLSSVLEKLFGTPLPFIELALALATPGAFAAARNQLEHAKQIDSDHAILRFLLPQPLSQHIKQADFYAHQGDYALALRYYEAALILDPSSSTAQSGRARVLMASQALGINFSSMQ